MSESTDANVRLFVGAKVSLETANLLAPAARAMEKSAKTSNIPIRWLSPATYHLTLKFLGWTRGDAIGAIEDGVKEALRNAAPFEFETKGIDAFPSLDEARVLWAGIHDETNSLIRLGGILNQALALLGYPPDEKTLHPHVTLGRLKLPSNVRDVVACRSEQAFSTTRVESITLFKSTMKTNSSEYTNLVNWSLNSR